MKAILSAEEMQHIAEGVAAIITKEGDKPFEELRNFFNISDHDENDIRNTLTQYLSPNKNYEIAITITEVK